MSIIAVLDDEPDIVELITVHLKNAHHEVHPFYHPDDLLGFLEKQNIDLLILDLMLPDKDGLEVCKLIRNNEATSDMGIIMLTAKGEELDRVLGLELGADDYMTKPFSPKELLARVKAVLRRKLTGSSSNAIRTLHTDLVINLDTHEVILKDEVLNLTTAEFRILELLSEKPGRVYNRDQILSHLWGNDKAVIDRTIDVHIRHLRSKLQDQADLIQSVRGVGYKLKK